jgi:hypothetical protein
MLAAFMKLRPFAYHTTAADNLGRIRTQRMLKSTRRLFEEAGLQADARLRQRRTECITLETNGEGLMIRDQRPIAAGAIIFEPGWTLELFLERLNALVFFWPGDELGPIACGRRHFGRYASQGERLFVLRARTSTLIETNRTPLFSRCNSGSARMNGGKPLVRGGNTFLPAESFGDTAGA